MTGSGRKRTSSCRATSLAPMNSPRRDSNLNRAVALLAGPTQPPTSQTLQNGLPKNNLSSRRPKYSNRRSGSSMASTSLRRKTPNSGKTVPRSRQDLTASISFKPVSCQTTSTKKCLTLRSRWRSGLKRWTTNNKLK